MVQSLTWLETETNDLILMLDKKKTFITRLSHLLLARVCVCIHTHVCGSMCVWGVWAVGGLRVMLGDFIS